MLKKIIYYFGIMLLLIGCLEPESSGSKEIESDPPKENEKTLVNKPIFAKNNLGSIFFFGNSHTWNTVNLEKMLNENGYEAKIYHIHTGGYVPLGNDWYTNMDGSTANGMFLFTLYGDDSKVAKERYRKEVFNRSHLLNLSVNDKDQIFRDNEKEKIGFFPDDTSWIIVHDGTVFNSLTSAGAFMGLASAFGAKTACYQSWDLNNYSVYAAKKFHLPMIPVGGVILSPEVEIAKTKYQMSDGHMNNMGKYMYCVLFTHFFTGLPIDEIKGNAGLPTTLSEDKAVTDKTFLTEQNKTEMKNLMKRVVKETDDSFKNVKPYYECVKDFDKFSQCKLMEESKEYVATLQLSQPAIFNLPKGTAGKKIKVEVKSNKDIAVPDIWFYNAAEKKLTAQGTNTECLRNYTFIGNGDSWETDGSKALIITRRGKTMRGGDNFSDDFDDIIYDANGMCSIIEESIDETVDFTIKVSFVD